ncbi:unnamed protein product [Symbiodinium microadriaticum]|nr:unnamed protein product [Symbiodinium microadriaticum]
MQMMRIEAGLMMFAKHNIDMHHIVESTPGPLGTIDLPPLDLPSGGFMKCFIDVIVDMPSFPFTEIKQVMQNQSFKTLPKPYGLAKDVDAPFRIDLAVLPQESGKFTVVKIVNFKDKKNTPDYILFEQMGGFQCRHHVLRTEEEGKPEQERSLEEWDFGFDFIEAKGPRENVRNQLLRWVSVQTTSRDSPIYRWPQALVEKSLRNLGQDGALAQVHEVWPLTLYDLDARVLKALGTIFASLTEKALGLHGTPGTDNTPVARIVAMALSRYWITKLGKAGEMAPSFRQASEFDLFRGQSGTQTRPDIFDDGCLCEQPFKKVKAFTDVGNIESMSKERWGAAKWVRGQARTYCSSDFDIKTEPPLNQPFLDIEQGIPTYVSQSDFMKMLESAWCSKDCNDANIMAVLQRTHIFVNTAKCDKIDFLHVDSRKAYDYHRKGGQDVPQDFEMKVNWERDWVAKAMGGKMRCLAADYVGKAIQVDDSPKAANGPAIKDDPREAAKEPSIKKEIVSAFSRSLSSTDVTINLVDSPEKRSPMPGASSAIKPTQDDHLERDLEVLLEAELAKEETKNNDDHGAEAPASMDCCTDDENFLDTHMDVVIDGN